MPKSNPRISVKVPKRSGFDKSFRNSGSLQCGSITPVLLDEVIPNSRVSLKLNLAVNMPPLVSDTYMNVKLKAEAFFIPSRLCCASFEAFFCDVKEHVGVELANYTTPEYVDVVPRLPYFIPRASDSDLFGRGSLADYLGVRVTSTAGVNPRVLALPFVAYHLVWQEYYRNPRVQRPAFMKDLGNINNLSVGPSRRIFNLPYHFFHESFTYTDSTGTPATAPYDYQLPLANVPTILADGHNIFMLRQRNFGLDYFTSARVSAQQGDPVKVDTNLDGDNTFSIAQLRAANSLQQFRERNNLPSTRLVDQVKARYGANLSDGVAQRPICLGSASYDVATRSVDQTAGNEGSSQTAFNPFGGVAAQYGRAYGAGSDFIIDDFIANEPGYILVNVTLVPEVTYSFGVDPLFFRYLESGSITDMANPLLQNVGDQPIYVRELREILGDPAGAPAVFGYTDRYADFMFKANQVHGKLRPSAVGEHDDLSPFVLQRNFVLAPQLSSSFLEIPTSFLDQVLTYAGSPAWYDALLEYKVSMPLAEYCLPSLQDPAYEHGDTVSLYRNGQIF